MKNESEKALLSIHRVETTQYRDGKFKPMEIKPFDSDRSAKLNFEGIAIKEAKHLISNWAFSCTEIYSTIDLFVNDELIESVTIKAGLK